MMGFDVEPFTYLCDMNHEHNETRSFDARLQQRHEIRIRVDDGNHPRVGWRWMKTTP